MSTFSDAKTETKCHRDNCNDAKAYVYKRADLYDLLNQTDVDGVRLYMGELTNGDKTQYAVGVVKDANGDYNDFGVGVTTALSTGKVFKAYPCPDWCNPSNNILNS